MEGNEILKILEQLPTIPGLLRSVESVHPDYTLYRYIGMPYGGLVEGKFDFHRTFFSPKTDVGPLGREMDNFFDHGMFPGIGFDPVGRATIMTEESPEGRIFNVMVQKSNKYHDLVFNLYNEGILFGSAQAIASSYKVDPKTGEILRFIPAEWSFTVTPSNLLARPISVVRSVAQDIFIRNSFNESDFNIWFASRGFGSMETNTPTVAVSPLASAVEETPVAQPEAVVTPAAAEATPVTETTEAEPARSVTERIEEVIQRAENRAPAVEADADQTARILHNMATVMRALYDGYEAMSQAVTAMQAAQTARDTSLDTRLQSIEDSIVRSADASLTMISRALQDSVVRALQEDVVAPLLGASEDEKRTFARRQQGAGATPAPVTNSQIPTVKAAPPGFGN